MTGKQNYTRAIEFKGHDHLPMPISVNLDWLQDKDERKSERVRERVSLFGKFNGGDIGGTSRSVMPETPLDNVIAMFEAFAEYRIEAYEGQGNEHGKHSYA